MNRPPDNREVPVVIVGAGPVGLFLAVELGRHGVECLLVEQQAEHFVGFPTTNNLSIRTMEHLRRWGIASRVREAVAMLPYARLWLTSIGGYELARVEYPRNGDAVPLPYSPETFVWAPKPFFDPILAELAHAFASVRIRFGWRFDAFQQDGDGVSVSFTDAARGEQRSVRAQYLVGCDGGSSEVRRQAGLERVGLFVDRAADRGVSVYFRAPSLVGRLPLPAAHVFLMHPRWRSGRQGPPILVSVDGHQTWRIGIPPPPHGGELDVNRYLHELLGSDGEIQVIQTRPGTLSNRAVNRHYRAGRVFVAGDAAHVNTPVGGLGANTGMQDAIDLGWKLAAVVHGWGGPRLLDSYEVERRPVALALLRYQGVDCSGEGPTAVMPPFGQPPAAVPASIEDDTAAAARERRSVGRDIWREQHGHYDHPGLELGFHYDGSPVCVPDGTPGPPEELTTYTQTARPGARAPHAWLSRQQSTLDLFDHWFTLLRTGGMTDTQPLEQAAEARGLPLRVVDVHRHEIWTLYERRLILVRPDGFVAWRADHLPADPLALVDRVRGAE